MEIAERLRKSLAAMRLIAIVALVAAVPGIVAAQSSNRGASPTAGEAVAGSAGPENLRVFIDCSACDFDHLRRTLPYLNYMREPYDADVHVLVTTQATSDGLEYTISFIGRGVFAGVDDVLRYASSSRLARREIDDAIAHRIQLGLLRYAARTAAADAFRVEREPIAGSEPGSRSDPWNLWVFRFQMSASASGERSLASRSVFGAFSANRISQQWKTLVGITVSTATSRFDLTPTSRFTNSTRTIDINGLLVGSLGAHWAWAVGSSATAATFVNQDLTVRVAPGLQYNVFPYDESTRRQLTITYAVGATAFDYEELTIFGKASETLADETFTAAFDFRQPWGQSGFALEAAHFLSDPGKYRVVAVGTTNVRIVRGLSLNVTANVSRIGDQVFLPAAGLTPEEILVQRRQLATDYRYAATVGFTIAFGSPYSNIVNSRFAGSSGGIIRTF